MNASYNVPLNKQYLERLYAGEKLAAYAVTVINSPDEREAMLDYRAAGPFEVWVNGQPVAEPAAITGGEPLQSVVFNKFQGVRRTSIFPL